MQNHITAENLRNLGVELDDKELQKLADELSEKVDERVGTEVIAALTPEDTQALADMEDKASDDELAEWIVQHVPDYEEIISDHRDIVLGDFVETSGLIPDTDEL